VPRRRHRPHPGRPLPSRASRGRENRAREDTGPLHRVAHRHRRHHRALLPRQPHPRRVARLVGGELRGRALVRRSLEQARRNAGEDPADRAPFRVSRRDRRRAPPVPELGEVVKGGGGGDSGPGAPASSCVSASISSRARGCSASGHRVMPSTMHPGEHVRTRPDNPAVVMAATGATLTYRQLDEAPSRAARLFRALGLRPGDGIAILLENHSRFYEIVWGAQRAGLYYTPLSTRLTPGEVEYIVGDCDAKVLVTSAAMGDLATALVERMPGVATRLMLAAPRPPYP